MDSFRDANRFFSYLKEASEVHSSYDAPVQALASSRISQLNPPVVPFYRFFLGGRVPLLK